MMTPMCKMSDAKASRPCDDLHRFLPSHQVRVKMTHGTHAQSTPAPYTRARYDSCSAAAFISSRRRSANAILSVRTTEWSGW